MALLPFLFHAPTIDGDLDRNNIFPDACCIVELLYARLSHFCALLTIEDRSRRSLADRIDNTIGIEC